MGVKQIVFFDDEQATARKQANRKKSLAEMEAVVPWGIHLAPVDSSSPKTSKKGGRPPYPPAGSGSLCFSGRQGF